MDWVKITRKDVHSVVTEFLLGPLVTKSVDNKMKIHFCFLPLLGWAQESMDRSSSAQLEKTRGEV